MADKRNLTIQLDADTLRKARILAVQRDVSVSRLVAEEIERAVTDEEQYRAAHRQALDLMRCGLHLGGGTSISREELYDRGQ